MAAGRAAPSDTFPSKALVGLAVYCLGLSAPWLDVHPCCACAWAQRKHPVHAQHKRTRSSTPPPPSMHITCRHTSRFLFVFNNSLPFALYPAFGWGCLPFSVGISALLLGIDEIGVQIEEPL